MKTLKQKIYHRLQRVKDGQSMAIARNTIIKDIEDTLYKNIEWFDGCSKDESFITFNVLKKILNNL